VANVDSIPIRVHKDTPGLGKTLPAFAVAIRARPRRDDHIFRFEPTGPALHLEDHHPLGSSTVRIVGQKVALRRKAFHSDRHITLLLTGIYTTLPAPTKGKFCKGYTTASAVSGPVASTYGSSRGLKRDSRKSRGHMKRG